jgi:hypothetical protein
MIKQFGITLMAIALTGCHSLGPKSITGSHALYSQAVALSLNEQFLNNLVRLRYRDTPYFLEVGNITASLRFESSVGLDAAVPTGGASSVLAPNVGFSYSTSPTISYAPLQGEDFLRKLLVAVPLESLFVLMQSGWKANRVLGICVERINQLENAPTASGPTPDRSPDRYEEFGRFLTLLENVRNKELIRSKIDAVSAELLVQIMSGPGDEKNITEIKGLLGLDPEEDVYSVSDDFLQERPDAIAIRTRSIMSILFYLSQSVEVPMVHEEAGLVTVTRSADGSIFDWHETPAGQLFRIHQSRERPESAFLAIAYRDHWFYIADNDLDSKSSFMLMSQLFSLNAGTIKSVSPMLTIPVSR